MRVDGGPASGVDLEVKVCCAVPGVSGVADRPEWLADLHAGTGRETGDDRVEVGVVVSECSSEACKRRAPWQCRICWSRAVPAASGPSVRALHGRFTSDACSRPRDSPAATAARPERSGCLRRGGRHIEGARRGPRPAPVRYVTPRSASANPGRVHTCFTAGLYPDAGCATAYALPPCTRPGRHSSRPGVGPGPVSGFLTRPALDA